MSQPISHFLAADRKRPAPAGSSNMRTTALPTARVRAVGRLPCAQPATAGVLPIVRVRRAPGTGVRRRPWTSPLATPSKDTETMPTVPAAPPAPGGSASASTTPPLSQFDTDKAAWPPERPSLEVAKDKLAATLGDIALIARRSLTPKAPRVTTAPTPGAGGATLRLAATRAAFFFLHIR